MVIDFVLAQINPPQQQQQQQLLPPPPQQQQQQQQPPPMQQQKEELDDDDISIQPFNSKSNRITGSVAVIINGKRYDPVIKLSKSIIESLESLDFKDVDVYEVKNGIANKKKMHHSATPNSLGYRIIDTIHLIVKPKEPKSKSSKSSKSSNAMNMGGSKTRKHRHQKKTIKRNPRKLISRRQKYSRRK
jgi:hypothetical protein